MITSSAERPRRTELSARYWTAALSAAPVQGRPDHALLVEARDQEDELQVRGRASGFVRSGMTLHVHPEGVGEGDDHGGGGRQDQDRQDQADAHRPCTFCQPTSTMIVMS